MPNQVPMNKNSIKSIVVEGFDGSGKSTIAKWIAENLNYEYHKSPSENFAKVREEFDSPDTPIHERLAFYTGDCIRISMLMEKEPYKNYVFDRYYYSTLAYHNAKYPGSTDLITKLCSNLKQPDLVILVRANYNTIHDRIAKRNENSKNDVLFLEENLVKEIYCQYQSTVNVPMIEINNNGNLSDAIDQIKNYFNEKGIDYFL